MISFTVNSKPVKADVDSDMPLLWYLRDVLNLKGTKFGCGIALCGACTVHVDGMPVRSCSFPVSAAEGTNITTIELINETKEGKAVQEAWLEENVPQCGYCQSGFIMATTALLKNEPEADEETIDNTLSNICRCGTYPAIRRGIKKAKTKIQSGS